MFYLPWNYLMQEVWQGQATRAEVVVLLHLIKLDSSEGQEDLPSAHLDLFSLNFEHGQAQRSNLASCMLLVGSSVVVNDDKSSKIQELFEVKSNSSMCSLPLHDIEAVLT